MSPSVLGHLTLGYQLVWNRLRQIAAVQLFIDSPGEAPVDAEHLLRTLVQAWSLQSPQLMNARYVGPLGVEPWSNRVARIILGRHQ